MNPFLNATPAALLTRVREGVRCETCEGNRFRALWWETEGECPTCSGTGRVPLLNADLDALAACVCEGEWVRVWRNKVVPHFWQRAYAFPDWGAPVVWDLVPTYTTSPDAVMQLRDRYKINTQWFPSEGEGGIWGASATPQGVALQFDSNPCCAETKAALVAALTEAMKGDGDANS